jgi:hypothetical protein
MSWKDEINKTKSIKRLKRFDEQAGDTRESMLDYAVYEILTLVKNRSEVSLEDLPLKKSIIEVINDAIRRVNNISKERLK